jgi:primosomal protein N'
MMLTIREVTNAIEKKCSKGEHDYIMIRSRPYPQYECRFCGKIRPIEVHCPKCGHCFSTE